MDEPVSGLDPAGICAFRSIIRDLRRREASVLIADHTLTELENICTHICFLRKGMISCIAPVDELLKRFDNLGEAYRYYNLTIS
jgi:ABC-type multidrug transport system ATPase subunit